MGSVFNKNLRKERVYNQAALNFIKNSNARLLFMR